MSGSTSERAPGPPVENRVSGAAQAGAASPAPPPDPARLSSLAHWLVAGAPGHADFSALVAEIGARLVSSGLPVDQSGIYKTMVHPEIPGRLDYWSAQAGARTVELTPAQLRSGDLWLGTPAQACTATERTVDYRPGRAPEFDGRPDMQRLKARGYTQLLCLPLHSRYTPAVSVASFSTKAPVGFSTAQTEAIRRLQAPIARVTESFILHASTVAVLSAYVGRDAGARVLTGNIMRGHTEVIPAIILFVDIRGFTRLVNERPPGQVVALLNIFFSALDRAVRAHGGEILKFVGDGALCIYPTPDDHSAQRAAAAAALSTVEDARAALAAEPSGGDLAFRAALHLGDVDYGNIGSPSRLDFTVIGRAVNFAARMLEAAAALGEDTVCSREIASLLETSPRLLGEQPFRGFAENLPLFAPD